MACLTHCPLDAISARYLFIKRSGSWVIGPDAAAINSGETWLWTCGGLQSTLTGMYRESEAVWWLEITNYGGGQRCH